MNELGKQNESLDLEKEALQTAQNRFDTENELLDYKVKELEAKVKDLTDVGAKEINEENKVLKNKTGDALDTAN